METGATADLTLARKAAEGGEVARLLGRTYKATESLRMLAALPSNTISAEQRTALLAASVMQAEGEHDDVYRHLLREVRGPGGDLVAFIGVTYDVNLAIGAPPSAAWVLLLAGWLLGSGPISRPPQPTQAWRKPGIGILSASPCFLEKAGVCLKLWLCSTG
jgi:hypothetical protein